jgi:hypothetical protein
MRWYPSQEEIQYWLTAKEDDFARQENSRYEYQCEAMEGHVSLL